MQNIEIVSISNPNIDQVIFGLKPKFNSLHNYYQYSKVNLSDDFNGTTEKCVKELFLSGKIILDFLPLPEDFDGEIADPQGQLTGRRLIPFESDNGATQLYCLVVFEYTEEIIENEQAALHTVIQPEIIRFAYNDSSLVEQLEQPASSSNGDAGEQPEPGPQ